MKRGLFTASGVFGVLAIILYFASIKKMDASTAYITGISEVANLQGTVFCAACVVVCAICLVGGIILHYLECNSSVTSSVDTSSRDISRGAITQTTTIAQNSSAPSSEGIKQRQEPMKNYFVCPDCNLRSSRDYIMVHKKCPKCGKELI